MCSCRTGYKCSACMPRIVPTTIAKLREQYEQTKRELAELEKKLGIKPNDSQ
jgi:ferredoxin